MSEEKLFNKLKHLFPEAPEEQLREAARDLARLEEAGLVRFEEDKVQVSQLYAFMAGIAFAYAVRGEKITFKQFYDWLTGMDPVEADKAFILNIGEVYAAFMVYSDAFPPEDMIRGLRILSGIIEGYRPGVFAKREEK